MISESRGPLLISLYSFLPSYPTRIFVNCFDESIALAYEEETFILLFLAAPSEMGSKLSHVQACT